MTVRELARIAYKKYGQVTDFKNYQGFPMPEFDALPDKIKEAWEQASLAAHAVGYYEAMSEMKEHVDEMQENIDEAIRKNRF